MLIVTSERKLNAQLFRGPHHNPVTIQRTEQKRDLNTARFLGELLQYFTPHCPAAALLVPDVSAYGANYRNL
jgi:hypothetical protein